MISLDAALRMDGIPVLVLWGIAIYVLSPLKPTQLPIEKKPEIKKNTVIWVEVDYVPPNVPLPTGRACLILTEDNDRVIQICIQEKTYHTSCPESS